MRWSRGKCFLKCVLCTFSYLYYALSKFLPLGSLTLIVKKITFMVTRKYYTNYINCSPVINEYNFLLFISFNVFIFCLLRWSITLAIYWITTIVLISFIYMIAHVNLQLYQCTQIDVWYNGYPEFLRYVSHLSTWNKQLHSIINDAIYSF